MDSQIVCYCPKIECKYHGNCIECKKKHIKNKPYCELNNAGKIIRKVMRSSRS
jgi:hypothetical protein